MVAAFGLLLAAAFVAPISASADPSNNPDFNFSRTFEFDPGNTGCAEAQWVNGLGLPDKKGQSRFGLVLEKNCPTPTPVSAGAVANSIRGTSATEVGYDMEDNSPCGAGSPRFNLTTEQGTSHFIGGCSNADPEDRTELGNGWTRYRFQLDDADDAFPPVPPGSTIASLVLIVDEEGSYLLDNIAVVNDAGALCAQKPGQSNPCPAP
jgi:hypothetical protein